MFGQIAQQSEDLRFVFRLPDHLFRSRRRFVKNRRNFADELHSRLPFFQFIQCQVTRYTKEPEPRFPARKAVQTKPMKAQETFLSQVLCSAFVTQHRRKKTTEIRIDLIEDR